MNWHMKACDIDPEHAFPEDRDSRWTLAMTYMNYAEEPRTGENGRTLEETRASYFDRALKFWPGGGAIYYLRGESRFKREEYGAALDDYRKAVELSPDQIDYLEKLAYAKFELGLWDEETIQALEKGLLATKGPN